MKMIDEFESISTEKIHRFCPKKKERYKIHRLSAWNIIYTSKYFQSNTIHRRDQYFSSPYLFPSSNPIIYIRINLIMLLYFEFSFEHTSIQLSIVILYLTKDLEHKVVNFILVPFIENWKCMCSNNTFRQNICFSMYSMNNQPEEEKQQCWIYITLTSICS